MLVGFNVTVSPYHDYSISASELALVSCNIGFVSISSCRLEQPRLALTHSVTEIACEHLRGTFRDCYLGVAKCLPVKYLQSLTSKP